jgi:hypothetical protein
LPITRETIGNKLKVAIRIRSGRRRFAAHRTPQNERVDHLAGAPVIARPMADRDKARAGIKSTRRGVIGGDFEHG